METRYFDSGDMGFDGTDEEFANYVKDSFMNAHNKEERFCRVEEPSFPFNHDSICGG